MKVGKARSCPFVWRPLDWRSEAHEPSVSSACRRCWPMLRVSTALSRAALGVLLLAAACGSGATTGGRAPAGSAPASGSSAGTPAPTSGASAAPAAGAADEQAVASFYRGKTIRIVVGFAPGGGFDTYARLIAKHLS